MVELPDGTTEVLGETRLLAPVSAEESYRRIVAAGYRLRKHLEELGRRVAELRKLLAEVEWPSEPDFEMALRIKAALPPPPAGDALPADVVETLEETYDAYGISQRVCDECDGHGCGLCGGTGLAWP